jgi:hypothetical protein
MALIKVDKNFLTSIGTGKIQEVSGLPFEFFGAIITMHTSFFYVMSHRGEEYVTIQSGEFSEMVSSRSHPVINHRDGSITLFQFYNHWMTSNSFQFPERKSERNCNSKKLIS